MLKIHYKLIEYLKEIVKSILSEISIIINK